MDRTVSKKRSDKITNHHNRLTTLRTPMQSKSLANWSPSYELATWQQRKRTPKSRQLRASLTIWSASSKAKRRILKVTRITCNTRMSLTKTSKVVIGIKRETTSTHSCWPYKLLMAPYLTFFRRRSSIVMPNNNRHRWTVSSRSQSTRRRSTTWLWTLSRPERATLRNPLQFTRLRPSKHIQWHRACQHPSYQTRTATLVCTRLTHITLVSRRV